MTITTGRKEIVLGWKEHGTTLGRGGDVSVLSCRRRRRRRSCNFLEYASSSSSSCGC
jgi:hypothetical protein